MKKLSKNLATALAVALLVSILTASASAASVSDVNNCTVNKTMYNLGQLQTCSGTVTGASGLDIGKLLEGFGLSIPTTAPGTTQSKITNKDDVSDSNTSASETQNATYEAPQSTDCTTPASPSVGSSGGAANVPEKVKTTESGSCKTGTCPESTGCNVGGTACKTDAVCLTKNCTDNSASCAALTTVGKSLGNNSGLVNILNRIFVQYRVGSSGACPVPTVPNEPGAGETTPPVGETTPPVGETTPPTEETTPPAVETTPPAEEPEQEDDATADNLAFERQVVDLVNEHRAANGLTPLTLDEQISRVARAKSQDMRDNKYFSHTSPTYGSPFDMLKSFGVSYRTAGENIAMGYGTPEMVVSGWMNSSGHRANILNGSFTRIGVGYVADGNYWTQMFVG